MTFLQILVLAVIQGITEFLPISSSGHLVLVPMFLQWPDQGLDLDVAVHMGTLVAVMLYFWRDTGTMARGAYRLVIGRQDAGSRLFLQIVLATIPVVIAGWLVKTYVGDALRSLEIIGWATLGFGLLLWVADRVSMTIRRVEHMGYGEALFIGVMQCLALIPGTSRSGITMTAARFLGYERPDAARFSMLLSMPTILAAGVLAGYDIYKAGDVTLTMNALLAAGLAAITALIAIALMMAWLKRASFGPFVLYRVILGGLLLWIAYGF